jgi:beta-galactosidase
MFYFGVDYYPEQWPEERWPIDVDLMSEAGFNVVRLADFAWSKIEPKPGCYDFTWLDSVISLLHRRDIRVILGTPTASPPAWLMGQHPQLFRVRDDGLAVTFGNRREYCPNQSIYHDYTRRIVTQMADHYADHPAVIGWQVDNEFGDRCYCPVCQKAFQTWLRQRYVSLDTLNQKWGTIFWSHVYTDWSQIPVPLKTGGSPNPGLAIEFSRFASNT